jgi:hypothetical protein
MIVGGTLRRGWTLVGAAKELLRAAAMIVGALTLFGGAEVYGRTTRAHAAPRVSFERVELPAILEAGRTYSSRLLIRNAGTTRWVAGGGIRISYHWKSPDGSVIVGDGERTLLPTDVEPGQSVTVCATLLVPERPGPARLEWDMVQEGVAWFSAGGPENVYSSDIRIAASAGASARTYVIPILFVAATLGHFGLVALWLVALSPGLLRRDEFAFHWFVMALGSFQAVLHTVAFTVGLSMGRGLFSLVALHVVLGGLVMSIALRRRRRGTIVSPVTNAPAPKTGHRFSRLLALAGGAVLSALVVKWGLAATRSLRVIGTDAAHYHVPYAVNIALGAVPFELPATAHLYPMGASVLAAWFILPFRDPLHIDLTVLPAFLLAWFAIGLLAGLITGRSNLTWGPWCVLFVFSVPLFRSTLLMSADLFYGAAFLAVNAVLLRVYARLRVTRTELVSLAFAIGMLMSTKVTGTFSAVLLVAVYGVAIVIRAWLSHRRFEAPAHLASVLSLAAVVLVASGGIWLIRNWWDYGSPLAPSGLALFGVEIFPGEKYGEGKYYLSVLKDLRDVPGYDLTGRLSYWMRRWLGAWFLPSCLAIPLAPFARAWLRGRWRMGDEGSAPIRLAFVAISAVVIAAHGFLIAGAPWSSLEWTDGFSLRYVLPCLALCLIAAYGSTVSLWESDGKTQILVCLAIAVMSVAWYAAHEVIKGAPVEETPATFDLAAIGLGVMLVGATALVSRWRRPWVRLVVGGLAVVVVATTFGIRSVHADHRLIQPAEAELDRLLSCSEAAPIDDNDYRGTYLQVLAYERSHAITCERRRFFVTTRWDLPLELQSPEFDNEVFTVAGPSSGPRLLAWDRPGSQACDYVIASRAALDTQRGVPLVNTMKARKQLRQAVEYRRFVVFATR